MTLSIGGGISKNSFRLGGSIGYFVVDNLMPGVSYSYMHVEFDGTPSYEVAQHNLNPFLRYYLFDLGGVLPFLMGDVGYLKYSEYGEEIPDESFSLFSVFGGGGLVLFVSNNFAIEGIVGVRRYASVPDEVDLDESEVEWNIGFGIYF